MHINEIIQNVSELIYSYPSEFAVLYGYHTYDNDYSVWAIKIAVYMEDYEKYSELTELISTVVDDSLKDENIKLLNLAYTQPYRLYELYMSGKLLFAKNRDFFNRIISDAMVRYFDYLPVSDMFLENSVKRIEGKKYEYFNK